MYDKTDCLKKFQLEISCVKLFMEVAVYTPLIVCGQIRTREPLALERFSQQTRGFFFGEVSIIHCIQSFWMGVSRDQTLGSINTYVYWNFMAKEFPAVFFNSLLYYRKQCIIKLFMGFIDTGKVHPNCTTNTC